MLPKMIIWESPAPILAPRGASLRPFPLGEWLHIDHSPKRNGSRLRLRLRLLVGFGLLGPLFRTPVTYPVWIGWCYSPQNVALGVRSVQYPLRSSSLVRCGKLAFHQAAPAALFLGVRIVPFPPLRLGRAQCCSRVACHGGVMAASSFVCARCVVAGAQPRCCVDSATDDRQKKRKRLNMSPCG